MLNLCNFRFLFYISLIVICSTGCTNKPTNEQLEAWRQETIAANDAMLKKYEDKTNNIKQENWELAIEGKTKNQIPIRFTWSQLEALATTHVKTESPHYTTDPGAILDFRGILVAALLEKIGVMPNVQEITFVAFDGYRSTVQLEDINRYPIILALERNGKPLSRSEGGPLLLVFPYTEYPQLKQQYFENFWTFYVTNLIVGTESPKLTIIDSSAWPNTTYQLQAYHLDQLEQITLETPVGYRLGWPISPVKLRGVRLRDILKTVNIKLNPTGSVVIRGKSPVYKTTKTPLRLNAQDILNCDILLARQSGETLQPIPAQLGGPLTLALSPTCNHKQKLQVSLKDERFWATFVEEIEVQ